MKILAIHFKNINSLKGEHSIDFTSDIFVRNPLFAITGATGSGKTTLLDVISLALFSEVPRLGKITKTVVQDQGAILTRGQTEAFARVDYECNQGRFSSVWNIHKASSGRVQNHTMEIYRLENNERLDLKNSEVPSKNEELIGLNYDQFIKSVLLAQGEFAKFLKADRKERSELLENITGTGIYRQIGILAYEKFKEFNIEKQNLINLLKDYSSRLIDEENLLVSKEKLEKLRAEKLQHEKQLDIFKKELEFHEEIRKFKTLIAKKEEILKLQIKQKEDFEKEKGEIIRKHESVSLFSSELNLWKNISEKVSDLDKEKNLKSSSYEEVLEEIKSEFSKVKKFIKEEIKSNQVEEKLQEFYKKVNELILEKDKMEKDFHSYNDLFKAELRELNLVGEAGQLIKQTGLWQNKLQENLSEKQKLKSSFEDGFPTNITEQILKKEEFMDLLNRALLEKQKLDILQTEIKKDRKKSEEISEELEKLPQQINDFQTKENILQKDLEILKLKRDNHVLESSLEEHRNKLEDGKACPLCGSVHHPYAERKSIETPVFEKEIKEKETDLQKLVSALYRITTQKDLWEKQLKNLQLEWKDKSDKEEALKKSFREKFTEKLDLPNKELLSTIEGTKQKINILKKLKDFKIKEEAFKRAQPIYDKIQSIISKGKEKSSQIAELYEGNNILEDVRNFENNWNRLKEQLRGLSSQLKEIDKKIKHGKKEFDKSEKGLLPKIKSLGFSMVSEAFSGLLPEADFQKFKKQIQDYKDQINIFSTELKTHISHQEKITSNLKTSLEEEELKISKAELEQKNSEIQKDIEEINRKIKNDLELQKRIENLQNRISEQEKENLRWKLLNKMIGDSKGNKFNQFAQDLTLKHLLKLANNRLKGINNRYELVMIPGQDDNKDNLAIADMDMGGQRRAVHTLSGGETFLMSLGLALALSDLAAQKININSLFIDEGFGTLDPETLDQTLDTLERLQASSTKTIGIISHVDSLKERIGTQIQLNKTGQGYSTLKIVSG